MAQRPLFIPILDGVLLVKTVNIEFEWFPGLSVAQKQRSIQSMQSAARCIEGIKDVLDVSSKSKDKLGVELSAFNLRRVVSQRKKPVSVESAFQASKTFENGGPYTDIYDLSSRDAKRDPRLQTSGRLVAFRFDDATWPLEPRTAFYDWLYISALKQHPNYIEALKPYSAFTDIEFNPAKSINCQAYSVALCMSLLHRGLLETVTADQSTFLSFLGHHPISRVDQCNENQGLLL